MSMNLYIRVDGKDLNVYQTPTHITYMCLVDSNGKIKPEVYGKKALRAIHTYLLWVDQKSDGVYEDAAHAKSAKNYVEEHKKYILDSISSFKKLEVYTI